MAYDNPGSRTKARWMPGMGSVVIEQRGQYVALSSEDWFPIMKVLERAAEERRGTEKSREPQLRDSA